MYQCACTFTEIGVTLERQINELGLLRGREPHPSVEVNAESRYAAGLDLIDVLEPILVRFAKANPSEKATISLYSTFSANFAEPGRSDFLIVQGNSALLHAVSDAFAAKENVLSRFGDDIPPIKGQAILHLEDGRCWQVLDAVTWFSNDEEAPAAVESVSSTDGESESIDELPADEEGTEWDLAPTDNGDDADLATVSARRGRLRAARADARIGTIRQTIERLFGLPEGSVALCGPDRRALRADASIGTLRRRWQDK